MDANGDSAEVNVNIEEPIDFIRFALNENVVVKMRNERVLSGILHAFDQHLNMVLSDVVETINIVETDPESSEEIHKSTTREIPLLFIRGDSVILVSTPNRPVV
uniref:U6 snRNA-associated Sm-like protein LSm3 n=1 Tax=Panagrellus redivivus TaxID=6233 RepID=A0A7E4V274_PANRE